MADNELDVVRFTLRLPERISKNLTVMAKTGSKSRNDFIIEALDFYMRYLDGYVDFDNPLLQRINQLTDSMAGMGERIDTVSNLVRSMIENDSRQLLGSNYLTDLLGDAGVGDVDE